jgi:dolichol-phosphate mannosyltransferase
MNSGSTWLRFNLVGVLGFVVQAAVLWALVTLLRIPAALAVAAAVLAAVSHNFAWHERFTWPGTPRAGRLKRWVGFNATTGALSIAANVALTGAIARATGLPVVAANLVAVVLLSVATFVVSDRVVFRARAS